MSGIRKNSAVHPKLIFVDFLLIAIECAVLQRTVCLKKMHSIGSVKKWFLRLFYFKFIQNSMICCIAYKHIIYKYKMICCPSECIQLNDHAMRQHNYGVYVSTNDALNKHFPSTNFIGLAIYRTNASQITNTDLDKSKITEHRKMKIFQTKDWVTDILKVAEIGDLFTLYVLRIHYTYTYLNRFRLRWHLVSIGNMVYFCQSQ